MADALPTIEQSMAKADSLAGIPMDDEEAREWFEQTCRENTQRERTKGGRDE